ncbi:hypothetical protein V7654_15175 [Bacillus sp. JJ1609]|uniref:hypothetical protein n=1 Tax=Bacillus sp. JJ1609 TaxID=3122977 RepID=UPI002FFFC642
MVKQVGLWDYTEAYQEEFDEIRIGKKPLIDGCISWINDNNLTGFGRKLLIRNGSEYVPAENLLLGVSVKRDKKKTRTEIKTIVDKAKQLHPNTKLSGGKKEDIWKQVNDPSFLYRINSSLISPNALAFYRPFHYTPSDDWGIYLLIDKILNYYESIVKRLGQDRILFSPDILLGYITYQIFHHEFFHHMVESAATTLEVISSSDYEPYPFYIKYRKSAYKDIIGLGEHAHDPLEEALANAYSYNSFSFASRVNKGYKTMLVKAYQRSLLTGWKYAPAGYRSAGNYINSDYILGATQLLAQIASSPNLNPLASTIVAKNVLFNGHSAFCSKPDIPTYLVGSEENIRYFTSLIPAPNNTYTNLFWHEDFSEIDLYIQQKIAEKKKKVKI